MCENEIQFVGRILEIVNEPAPLKEKLAQI